MTQHRRQELSGPGVQSASAVLDSSIFKCAFICLKLRQVFHALADARLKGFAQGEPRTRKSGDGMFGELATEYRRISFSAKKHETRRIGRAQPKQAFHPRRSFEQGRLMQAHPRVAVRVA
jgi:hypothetical protein